MPFDSTTAPAPRAPRLSVGSAIIWRDSRLVVEELSGRGATAIVALRRPDGCRIKAPRSVVNDALASGAAQIERKARAPRKVCEAPAHDASEAPAAPAGGEWGALPPAAPKCVTPQGKARFGFASTAPRPTVARFTFEGEAPVDVMLSHGKRAPDWAKAVRCAASFLRSRWCDRLSALSGLERSNGARLSMVETHARRYAFPRIVGAVDVSRDVAASLAQCNRELSSVPQGTAVPFWDVRRESFGLSGDWEAGAFLAIMRASGADGVDEAREAAEGAIGDPDIIGAPLMAARAAIIKATWSGELRRMCKDAEKAARAG